MQTTAGDNDTDIVDQFFCCVCREVMMQPARSPCEHRLCVSCMQRVCNKTDVFTCPMCRRRFVAPSAFEIDRGFQKLCQSLLLLCPNHEHGCSWVQLKSTVSNNAQIVAEHVAHSCEAKTEDCANDCGKKIKLGQQRTHDETECTLLAVACFHPRCDWTGQRSAYAHHEEKKHRPCPMWHICQFKALDSSDYKMHVRHCPPMLLHTLQRVLNIRRVPANMQPNVARYRSKFLKSIRFSSDASIPFSWTMPMHMTVNLLGLEFDYGGGGPGAGCRQHEIPTVLPKSVPKETPLFVNNASASRASNEVDEVDEVDEDDQPLVQRGGRRILHSARRRRSEAVCLVADSDGIDSC